MDSFTVTVQVVNVTVGATEMTVSETFASVDVSWPSNTVK